MDEPSGLPAKEVERWLFGVRVGGDATTVPKSPKSVTMATSEAAVLRAPVWVAERHQDDWTATVGSQQAVVEDCCTDGAEILSTLNPESFQMPIGTRVVCIKTQHLDNLHIAMQNGMWITGDKVGAKINRVFEQHNPEAGEKVFFIFSINRQRAFCALAEMSGLWTQQDHHVPGWQEAAGSFNIVGCIPIMFTHVKNIANDHFEHIHHENPNQPITNMWNGMHFGTEKGREVVKIFHEKPHFTNVLCRDKRKRYSPFDPVTNAQDVDPTLARKFTAPPHKPGYARSPRLPPLAITNWRHGNTDRDDTTPTRAQFPKRIEAKAKADFKTSTPTQPRTMRRDHAPAPLRLVMPTMPAQPSPSPRPGQIIRCYVDAYGNYIPIGPFEDSPGAPAANSHGSDSQGLTFSNQPTLSNHTSIWGEVQHAPSTSHLANIPDVMTDVPHAMQPNLLSHSPALDANPPSMPSFASTNPDFFLNPQPAVLPSDRTSSTDLLRRDAMDLGFFLPSSALPQPPKATDTSSAGLYPPEAAHRAYERNEDFLRYQRIRRQAQGNMGGSPAATERSEYPDWASNTEIERQRIPPVSPLTDSDPLKTLDSVSKGEPSPGRAFRTSVNRQLRDMRQGQRATPTPSRIRSDKTATEDVFGRDSGLMQSSRAPSKPAADAHRNESVDGGVRIPSSSAQPNGTAGQAATGKQRPHGIATEKKHSRGLSNLSGVGQLPSSMLPAMVSAGQYAPPQSQLRRTESPTDRFLSSLSHRAQSSDTGRRSDSKQAANDTQSNGADSSQHSDLIRFTP